jgi:hypothetical protein
VNLTALPLTGFGITGCGGATCVTRSSLSSDYTAWNIDLKAKSDLVRRVDGFAVHRDRWRPRRHQPAPCTADIPGWRVSSAGWIRAVNAALKWTDVGAKLGLRRDMNLRMD